MLKIEEEELGFAPDKDEPPQEEFEPDFDNSESGQDSDASDGELGGKDKRELFSDILGAIKAFNQQHDGNTSYSHQQNRYASKRKQDLAKARKKKKGENVASSIQPVARFKDIKQSDGKPPKLPERPPKKSVSPGKLERINFGKVSGILPKQREQNLGDPVTPKNIQIPDLSSSSTVITSTAYQVRHQETREEREVRVALRQKIAQQGLLNRIGMRMQATKTVPQEAFLARGSANRV